MKFTVIEDNPAIGVHVRFGCGNLLHRSQYQFPIDKQRLETLLYEAYRVGVKEAQANVRKALGV